LLSPSYPTEHDIYLFRQGNLFESYRMLGAHPVSEDGKEGVSFNVWAPRAADVRVVGDFNGWDGAMHALRPIGHSGIWSLFVPGIGEGTVYKYEVHSEHGDVKLKSDPYAFYSEVRPANASVVKSLEGFHWTDGKWRQAKKRRSAYNRPMNIYELHLGSWRIKGIEDFYTYEEMADMLVDYVLEMGYTHIEVLPLAEHPFDRSWGYQITGYFSVTSRYGTPEQFKYMVNKCHENGIGVIMDWVPGHFNRDDHGLRMFDGTPTYEYADPNKADKPLWGTSSFDFGRPEVISFLISNALFWFDVYHIDGLRVDAVASMMSLNFDKPEHMWTYNQYGGHDNLQAIDFLKKLNEVVFARFPDALMIAEDSSDRPQITAPTDAGGLGFNYKWNMGWMNDILRYMKLDPISRKDHHNLLTFSIFYAFSENFILPFSHDEVVHGKKSLLDKMPGDYWQKFANLRALLVYMIVHPGKKLLFMGGELAMFSEWKDLEQLDWDILEFDMHKRFHGFVRHLNAFYKEEPALWEADHAYEGFEWIDCDNASQSIISFIRKGRKKKDELIVIINFTPIVYHQYRIGVPAKGVYEELLNSDNGEYGGSGQTNPGYIHSQAVSIHGREHCVELTIPPLAAVVLKRVPSAAKRQTALTIEQERGTSV
jgi:1,4-alpha-glucan branching enzyme